ncbi:MAG: type VI secretion system-associated FHA domain protein TagH [Methylococcaceae bacterium]|nr:type VI secretion system-associated FHA domain protein TagH [Methylococcaceae bacterium]
MLLTLKILSCRGLAPLEPTSVCFDHKRGTIGRASDNDLVLPDTENFISRHHAEIHYEGGRYILSDTSLSGTVIDDGEPLKKSSAELRDGMRIYIGDYELGVHVQESAQDGSYQDESPESELLTDIIAPAGHSYLEKEDAGHSFPDFDQQPPFDFAEDPADPFAGFDHAQAKVPDPLEGLENKPSIQDSFEPPNARFDPGPQEFPADFDFEELFGTAEPARSEEPRANRPCVQPSADDDSPLADPFDFGLPAFADDGEPPDRDVPVPSRPSAGIQIDEPPVQSEAPPVEAKPLERSDARPARMPEAPPSDRPGDPMLKILLEVVGIDEPHFLRGVSEEDTVRLIGLMFRDLIEGMMTLLRSRAELKNQFRVSVTTIRPVENNPLKFSVTVQDALNAMLKPGQRGYLKPLDAIQNGFKDISNHQLAITAGIQASLIDVLKRFDPERFEKQIEGGLFKNRDAKCWEAYAKAYEHLVSEGIENFFGNSFVNAYERQIKILESKSGRG